MADYTRCITALNKAAGRELDFDEVDGMFKRIQKTARDIKAGRIKGTDVTDASTPDGLIRMAAELEASRMVQEADRKARNAIMDAKTLATRTSELEKLKASGLGDVEAVRRLLVNGPDGKANQFSLETRVTGVSQLLKTKIQDTWNAMDRSFWEYIQREDKIGLLVREIRGEATGDAIAHKGAQAWLKMAEEARQWFNDKGGKIGHLEDWGMPQHHSQEMVARAGSKGWTDDMTSAQRVAHSRGEWVKFVMQRVDQSRYVDLAGNPLGEAGIVKILENAWDTIATNGATKIEPGKFTGAGARSNHHAEARQIHFRDAAAVLEYWKEYGERTFPDILMGHVETIAKDIAFLEHFGSNPDATFNLLKAQAEKAAKLADPLSVDKVEKQIASLNNLYDYASGKTKPVANQRVAATFDALRNMNVSGKLGSAFWASLIGDKVLFEAIGHVNGLPAFQRWHNEIRLLNPMNVAERQQLRRQALMLDYMTQAMSRFGEDYGRSSLSGKLANGVMKISGMAAVNDWRRGAWALTAMDTLGGMVKSKKFSEVGEQDMRLLGSYGITETDWQVWKLAKLEDLGHGNDTALTQESVARISDADLKKANLIPADDDGTQAAAVRRDAVVKLLGALTSESKIAVLEPGWEKRAMMYGGLQRGVIRDDLTRSFWQFKAFPITQFDTIMKIGMSRPTAGGTAGFLTMLPVMMTLAGGMLIQVQELLNGKDPRPMDNWKFWLAAFLKGGSLGLYGDFLFSQAGTTRYGTGPLEAIAGPTIGAAADLVTFVAQAPGKLAEGKDPQVAAKAINIAKGFVPGQNLWFTKAATDHLIFQNAQEALNPGYLSGMQARTRREFGNDYWWTPGEALPDRAPNLENALGQ